MPVRRLLAWETRMHAYGCRHTHTHAPQSQLGQRETEIGIACSQKKKMGKNRAWTIFGGKKISILRYIESSLACWPTLNIFFMFKKRKLYSVLLHQRGRERNEKPVNLLSLHSRSDRRKWCCCVPPTQRPFCLLWRKKGREKESRREYILPFDIGRY